MEIKIGDRYEKIYKISDEMIINFSSAVGDKNPIHLDDNYAKNTVFKKRIAPGLLIGSLISSILGNEFPGNGTIYMSQYLKFRNPVFVDDQVKIIIEATEIINNCWLKLTTRCTNKFENLLIEGEAIVVPPDSCILKP
jgi:3-hydroxybutyryl-CoA dehydratase